MIKYGFLLLCLWVPHLAYAELPILHVQPEMLDMGSITEGDEAQAIFVIRNNSKQMVEIKDVEASCGCTVAKPVSSVLAPGGFTQLKVTIDTHAKRGKVKKWIQVTDSMGNVAKVWLHFSIIASEHAVKAGHGIFDGKCASCHFTPAQDVSEGPAIYEAVCAMCHGDGAEGAYAPSLRGHADVNLLQQLIAEGVGTQHMPGFSKKAGGPLDDKQLHALSQWLLSLD